MNQQNQITLIGALIIASIISTPFIYAAVEPHIILTMDASQTTAPFTINNNTDYTLFEIDPDGAINNNYHVLSVSTDETVISVAAANDITDPIIIERYNWGGKSTYPSAGYHVPFHGGIMTGIIQRDSGVGNCVGGWFELTSGTWSSGAGSIGSTSGTWAFSTHEYGTAWLDDQSDATAYIVYNTDGATTCSFKSITAIMNIVLPGDMTITRGV